MTNQPIFKDVLTQLENKPQKQQTEKAQQQKQTYVKLIALGVFFILAIPMIIKIYFKGPYTSLIITIYWIIIVIIIGISLFFLGRYVKNKFFKK